MPRSQRNDNFIDKTFTVVADILLKCCRQLVMRKKLLFITVMECPHKPRVNMLKHYKTITKRCVLEVDPYDRSYIFYNIGLFIQVMENIRKL